MGTWLVVLVILCALVLGVRMLRGLWARSRSVERHQHALETLAGITQSADGPGEGQADNGRQAHVRLIGGAPGEAGTPVALPPPRPFSRPSGAKASPFRRPSRSAPSSAALDAVASANARGGILQRLSVRARTGDDAPTRALPVVPPPPPPAALPGGRAAPVTAARPSHQHVFYFDDLGARPAPPPKAAAPDVQVIPEAAAGLPVAPSDLLSKPPVRLIGPAGAPGSGEPTRVLPAARGAGAGGAGAPLPPAPPPPPPGSTLSAPPAGAGGEASAQAGDAAQQAGMEAGPVPAHSRRSRSLPTKPLAAAAATAALLAAVAAGVLLTEHGPSRVATRPSGGRTAPATHHSTTSAPATTVPQTTTTTAAPKPATLVSSGGGSATYQLTSPSASIVVHASGPCWIEVRAGSPGGQVIYEGTLAAGQQSSVTGPAWIRLGDPPNVSVSVDGTHMHVPGATAAVPLNLQFTLG